MTSTTGRGWLVAGLAVAVSVLIGSILAAMAWGGAFGQGGSGPARAGSYPGMNEFWHGHGAAPGMMDQGGCPGVTPERGSEGRGFKGGWKDN